MKEKSRTGRPRSLPTPVAQKRALKERGIETKGLKQSTIYRRYNYYITQGHKTSEPVQKAYAQKRDWLGYIEKKGTKARIKTGKGYISAEDYMMEYQKEKETELQLPPNANMTYGRYFKFSERVKDELFYKLDKPICAMERTKFAALKKVKALGEQLLPLAANLARTHAALYKEHIMSVSCDFTTENITVRADRRRDGADRDGAVVNPDISTGPSKRDRQTNLPMSNEASSNILMSERYIIAERKSTILKKKGEGITVTTFVEQLLRAAKRGYDVLDTQSAKSGAKVCLVNVHIIIFSKFRAKQLDRIRSVTE
jgi:hypothetical protein